MIAAHDKPQLEICCSFCGHREGDGRKLIIGPMVFICSKCVEACNKVLAKSGEIDDLEDRVGEVERRIKRLINHLGLSPSMESK